MIGRTIAHYHVLAKIGEGGMGVVYRAEDTRLKRTVALKFLRAQAIGGRRERERFIREAQAAAALEHPNICAVHEIEEAEGLTFIVMGYVEGKSLGEIIRSGPLPVEESICIAAQIAEGLREAHAHGIIHRDIKPGNIMIAAKNSVRITDFGLARLAGAEGVTRTRETVGTMYYMSPEQARGDPVDNRTDIWSLGVLLYQLVTGTLPFTGDYDAAVLFRIVNDEPPAPSALNPSVPGDLDGIIRRMLEKDPGKRYAGMGEVADDLERLVHSMQKQERPASVTGRRPARRQSRSVLIPAAIAVIVVGTAAMKIIPRLTHGRRNEDARNVPAAAPSKIDSVASEAARLVSLAVATYPGGNPRQAIEYLERAVAQDSTLVGAFSRLARIYTYNRDYEDALYCAGKVKRAALRSGVASEILRADILENWVRGEWSQAVQNMRLYLRDFDPDDPQVLLELGYVLSRFQKDYRGAVEALERFIEVVPADQVRQLCTAYNYLGNAWLNEGDSDRAVSAFAKAGKLSPDNTDIEHSLAYVKYFSGDYAGAIRDFEVLAHKVPRFYVTYRDLGLACFETGRWRKALDSYSRYIASTPPSAVTEGYILMGLVYLAQEDAGRAESMADSTLAREPVSIRAHWLKGMSMLRLRSDVGGAEKQLKIIDYLRERPGPTVDHAFYFHLKGMIDIRRKDAEAGLESLQDALAVCCRDDCIFFQQELAAGYLMTGRFDDSIRKAEALLHLNGNNAEMRCLLGRAYEAKGMLSTARDHYQRAARVWSGGDGDFVPRMHALERSQRI